MTTCYENLRKHDKDKGKEFYRLKNYLDSIEQNKTIEYHKKHGRE